MDRRRIMREMTYLTTETGRVVAGVLQEIAAIPVDAQDPALVAQALASARILDDPESFIGAPAAFARLSARLDALREGIDDDVR
jgi:hypothetical protein